MPNALVIDISRYQEKVNFPALKKGGTIGVILKATQSTGYVDPTFKQRYKDAQAAGLCVSTYHYLVKGNIAAQMDFYVNTVNPADGDRLVIDFEDKGLVIGDLEAAINRLHKIAPNCEITVYGANGFLGALLGGKKNSLLAETSLWVASYTTASTPTTKDLKGTWPVWSLWQYSDKGTVDGVDGPVDVNRWNGSPDTLPGWFNSKDEQKPEPPTQNPEPAPITETVTVDIGVPNNVAVVVSINGKPLATFNKTE